MSLREITPPAVEPVLLADAKLHLRVDHSAEDDLITSLITAAREAAEHITGRALITQTLELTIDSFPTGEIRLPRPRLASVTSITYDDAAGAAQVLDPAAYVVNAGSEPGRVLPAASAEWPETYDAPNAVRIRYVAGYGANGAAVPASIKAWMMLKIAALYKHREMFITGTITAELPNRFAEALLDQHVVYA